MLDSRSDATRKCNQPRSINSLTADNTTSARTFHLHTQRSSLHIQLSSSAFVPRPVCVHRIPCVAFPLLLRMSLVSYESVSRDPSSAVNGRPADRGNSNNGHTPNPGASSSYQQRPAAPFRSGAYVPPHLRGAGGKSPGAQPQAAPANPPPASLNANYPPLSSDPPLPSSASSPAIPLVAPSSSSTSSRQDDRSGSSRFDPPPPSSSQPSFDRSYDRGDRFGARDVRGGDYTRGGSSSSHDVRFSNFSSGGGGGRGGGRQPPSMQRDMRLEAELFGDVVDKPRGIEFKNYEDIPVETSGLDVPQPIDMFKQIECHEVLLSNIDLAGYDRPTPVQRHSIPISLAGRDLMACAQTGSGTSDNTCIDSFPSPVYYWRSLSRFCCCLSFVDM